MHVGVTYMLFPPLQLPRVQPVDPVQGYNQHSTSRSEGINNGTKNFNGAAHASTHDKVTVASEKTLSYSLVSHIEREANSQRAQKRRLKASSVGDSIIQNLVEPVAITASRCADSLVGRTVKPIAPPANGVPYVVSLGSGEVSPLNVKGFHVDAIWHVTRTQQPDRFYKSSKGGFEPSIACKDLCPDFFKLVYVYGTHTDNGMMLMCSESKCNQDGIGCQHIAAVNCGVGTVADYPAWYLRALHDGALDDMLFKGGFPPVVPGRTLIRLSVDVNRHGPMPPPAAATGTVLALTSPQSSTPATSGGKGKAGGAKTESQVEQALMNFIRGGNMTLADKQAILSSCEQRATDNLAFRSHVQGSGFVSGLPSRPGHNNTAMLRAGDLKSRAQAKKKKNKKKKK